MSSPPRTHRRGRFWRLARALLATLALTLFAINAATFTHDGWGGELWPKFIALHHGEFIVLSSVWNGGLHSEGWIYDRVGPLPHPWWPHYERIGDTYFGTPPYVSWLYAASIPLWNLGVLAGLAAALAHWRVRSRAKSLARGECPACGCSLVGLAVQVCPECGVRYEPSARAEDGPASSTRQS